MDEPGEILLGVLSNFGKNAPKSAIEKLIKKAKSTAQTQLDFLRFSRQSRVLSSIRNFTPLIEIIMEKFSEFFVEEQDFLFKKGEAIGIEKGIEKERRNFAKKLIESKTMTLEQIASITNLPLEFVKKLAAEFGNGQFEL